MYKQILEKVNAHKAVLIAVSKTKPNQTIIELYNKGQKHFGENKVQELVDKYLDLPKDIHWHFIGHLQTNKVKYIAPFVHLIHSVDSIKLLDEINKNALKCNRCIEVLLQIYIATEETKFGLSKTEAMDLLEYYTANKKNMPGIKIVGLMGMASNTLNTNQVQTEFNNLKNIFTLFKNSYFVGNAHFKEISMGMSGDYESALQQGSTLVRIGSLLFGER